MTPRNRPGNNPKRRIAPAALLSEQEREQLAQSVRYVGSAHHKRTPGNYGFGQPNPRPTKSLCDLKRDISLKEATQLLTEGIDQGLLSPIDEDGIPKYIWSVSEQGEVFEAKTDRNGTLAYHGYPLEEQDPMCKYVKSVWLERCRNTGR